MVWIGFIAMEGFFFPAALLHLFSIVFFFFPPAIDVFILFLFILFFGL